ncbi:MAG: DUF262 domain-containing protein [Treponemataceae bacterium]|nr:DUF262 domain-containing protein [Treponemataceae bacterium]
MSELTDRIQPTNSGLTTYLDDLVGGKYQIPTFQRNVVWQHENVKKLWDSIYKFYPLGSILIWKTDTKLQNHRSIGGHIIFDEKPRTEYQYILDGQQRTTSLLTSLRGGKIEGRDDFNPELYIDLTKENTDKTDDQTYKERFLFLSEIDDSKNPRNSERKRKLENGLIVKLNDISKDFGSLYGKINCLDNDNKGNILKQLLRMKDVFDNYRLSFIEIKGIEVSEVCQIFERINQAGKPLDIFDIVVAKTFVPESAPKANDGFYLRDFIDGFRDRYRGSRFVDMSDLGYLQTLAVLIRENIPNSGVQNITNSYLNNIKTQHIKEIWDDAEIAIRKTFDFFENYLHLQPYLIPYGYFYYTITAYFFRNENPDYDFLLKYFWYFSMHKDDLLSNTTHLRQHIEFLNSQKTEEVEFETFVLDKEKLRNAKYSAAGRMSRAVLALYASKEPRDWTDKIRKVNVSNFFVTTDKPNLHHIFPTNSDYVLEHNNIDQNSLMNIAFITQATNLDISNKDPIVYLKNYINDSFVGIMPEHFLPEILLEWVADGKLPDDAISVFIEKRIELIEADLREKLKGIDFQTIDTRV